MSNVREELGKSLLVRPIQVSPPIPYRDFVKFLPFLLVVRSPLFGLILTLLLWWFHRRFWGRQWRSIVLGLLLGNAIDNLLQFLVIRHDLRRGWWLHCRHGGFFPCRLAAGTVVIRLAL